MNELHFLGNWPSRKCRFSTMFVVCLFARSAVLRRSEYISAFIRLWRKHVHFYVFWLWNFFQLFRILTFFTFNFLFRLKASVRLPKNSSKLLHVLQIGFWFQILIVCSTQRCQVGHLPEPLPVSQRSRTSSGPPGLTSCGMSSASGLFQRLSRLPRDTTVIVKMSAWNQDR